MTGVVWLQLVTCLVYVTCLHGYPEGPPLTACSSMKPSVGPGASGLNGHVTGPRNLVAGHYAIAPYYIELHQDGLEFSDGQDIIVGIVANQTKGPQHFMGVMIQARKVICASNATIDVESGTLGTFLTASNPRYTLLQTLDCHGISASAAGHNSRQFKINETITWRAPNINGHVVFKATIVKDVDTYWTDVHSAILHSSGLGAPPTCTGCRHQVAAAGLLVPLIVAVYDMIKV